MPFDRTIARKLVAAAESAYSRGIHSEFIGKIAAQLKDALEMADAAALEVSRAKNESTRLQRELDEEKDHYRKLREKSVHTEALVQFVKDVSASPKGAAKKASVLLAAMGEAVEPKAHDAAAEDTPAL